MNSLFVFLTQRSADLCPNAASSFGWDSCAVTEAAIEHGSQPNAVAALAAARRKVKRNIAFFEHHLIAVTAIVFELLRVRLCGLPAGVARFSEGKIRSRLRRGAWGARERTTPSNEWASRAVESVHKTTAVCYKEASLWPVLPPRCRGPFNYSAERRAIMLIRCPCMEG